MKMKNLLMMMALVSTMSASAAMAQTAPSAAPAAPAAASSDKKAQHEEKFNDRKAKILDRLQKKQACVQAATDGKSLRACFPKMEKRWENRKGGAEKGAPAQEEGQGGAQ